MSLFNLEICFPRMGSRLSAALQLSQVFSQTRWHFNLTLYDRNHASLQNADLQNYFRIDWLIQQSIGRKAVATRQRASYFSRGESDFCQVRRQSSAALTSLMRMTCGKARAGFPEEMYISANLIETSLLLCSSCLSSVRRISVDSQALILLHALIIGPTAPPGLCFVFSYVLRRKPRSSQAYLDLPASASRSAARRQRRRASATFF